MPSYRGMGHDEFDTPAAQYLLWLDAEGETRGMVRWLPTTGVRDVSDLVGRARAKANEVVANSFPQSRS